MIVTRSEDDAVLTTEDVLLSLCNSVTDVLSAATMSQVRFSGMVQRISKTCLKPDIGCFVLFDGGFSGLVVINFSAAAAISLGTWSGGWRIMRTLGRRIIHLDPTRGFAAESVAATVLYTTAYVY